MLSSRSAPPISAPDASVAIKNAGFGSFPALLALGLTLLFLFLAPRQFSNFWPVDFNLWPQTLFLLGLAAIAVLLMISRIGGPKLEMVGLLLLLFLGWNLVSTLGTSYKHDAWLEMARVSGALVFYFVARVFSWRQGVWLALAASLGVAFLSAPAILDFLQTRNARQSAGFLNANLFASALVVALPLGLILPIWARKNGRGWLVFLGAIPFFGCLAGLAVTSSKGGFVAALVGFAVFAVFAWRARPVALKQILRKSWLLLLVLSLVFGALAAKTVGPRLLETRGRDDNSTQFRVYAWRGTLEMSRARPMTGWGPMSFLGVYPRFAQAGPVRTAHQSWLQIAAESGWPSLGLLLGAMGAATFAAWKSLKSENWFLAAGGVAGVWAFLAHGFFDAGWSATSAVLLFCVALALCTHDGAQISESKRGLNWHWLGAAGILITGGAGSQKVAGAEDALAQAEVLWKNQASRLALESAQSAIESAPDMARAQWKTGDLTRFNGGDALPFYERARDLQPERAGNWRTLADFWAESRPDLAEKNFAEAISRDPLNSDLLLERAKFRLARKDGRGFDDLNAVLALRDAPFGKYPAVTEHVNLDFARATILLAPRLKATGETARLQKLLAMAMADVKRARGFQAQNQLMARETGTPLVNADLDEIESDLRSLGAR